MSKVATDSALKTQEVSVQNQSENSEAAADKVELKTLSAARKLLSVAKLLLLEKD